MGGGRGLEDGGEGEDRGARRGEHKQGSQICTMQESIVVSIFPQTTKTTVTGRLWVIG